MEYTTSLYMHHALRAHAYTGPQAEKSPQVPANLAMPMTKTDLACGDSPFSVPAESPRVPADRSEKADFWVSTDLVLWRPQDPSFIASDCQINDRCYRRLDPEYSAWLKLKMHAVKAAADAGRVPAEAFDHARQRFNAVQARAIETFGEQKLLEAVRTLNVEKYRPPLPDEFEKAKPVEIVAARINPETERLARARGLVDEIRDKALALGWTPESLYFCDGYERHPIGPRYGLVCYIHSQDQIGEVTCQSIELIGPPPQEVRSRFYNADVKQPWIKPARQT